MIHSSVFQKIKRRNERGLVSLMFLMMLTSFPYANASAQTVFENSDAGNWSPDGKNSVNIPDSISYVFLVSVDGLRPDAITNLGYKNLPNFYRLRITGAFTDNARTDYYYTVTLPNHTTMLTGRMVVGAQGHNVTFNNDNNGTIASVRGYYVAGVFDVIHDNGLSTAMYAGKDKFNFLNRTWNGDNGAEDTVGTDDGRDKIDLFVKNSNTAFLMNTFISNMKSSPHRFSFIHFRDPDSNGHSYGWGSAAYNNSVKLVDKYLGQLFDLIDNDTTFTNKSVIILTADHGGVYNGHYDNKNRIIYTIPFYAWGPGVPAGMDLYVLNADSRRDPGTGRPDYLSSPQPIRNGDAGNLVTSMFNLEPISGATINAFQDLRITVPGGREDLPEVTILSPVVDQVFYENDTIRIDVLATSNRGNIAKVEFFANWNSIGTDTTAPYSFALGGLSLGNYIITARAVDSSGIGATASAKIKVIETVSIDAQESLPTGYFLCENYPNPFNPVTTISFGLPVNGNVKITIFNVLGKPVADLVNEWHEAGNYSVVWNTHGLPSGTYFYRIQVNDFIQTRKMVLLK